MHLSRFDLHGSGCHIRRLTGAATNAPSPFELAETECAQRSLRVIPTYRNSFDAARIRYLDPHECNRIEADKLSHF